MKRSLRGHAEDVKATLERAAARMEAALARAGGGGAIVAEEAGFVVGQQGQAEARPSELQGSGFSLTQQKNHNASE